MDATKRKKLEAAGWVVADHPAELLNLTDEERKIVDLSVSLSIAIRDRRTAMGMTQAQLTEVVARIRFQLFTGSRP